MRPLRIFFAVSVSNRAKKQITFLQQDLQKNNPVAAIKWTLADNLHITLQFLAAVKPEDLPVMMNEVKQQIDDFPHFDVEIGGLELFPDSHHPRVISLKVSPHAFFESLSQRIGIGIQEAGYATELRPFRPHLTIARLNNHHIKLEEALPVKKIIFPVHEITLFQSEGDGRSIYHKIATIPLT